jgi:pyruvate dehydrogenase E2 component (dihydrolipoamide acetyltransferase)
MLRTTHVYSAGTFTLSNLGMFGVDRFDAILPPGTVR